MRNFRVSENEYRVYGSGGREYSVFACGYKLKKGKATFFYWQKNLWNRWEYLSFEREDVERVSMIIEGEWAV